jgi:hypothetical protein
MAIGGLQKGIRGGGRGRERSVAVRGKEGRRGRASSKWFLVVGVVMPDQHPTTSTYLLAVLTYQVSRDVLVHILLLHPPICTTCTECILLLVPVHLNARTHFHMNAWTHTRGWAHTYMHERTNARTHEHMNT